MPDSVNPAKKDFLREKTTPIESMPQYKLQQVNY